MLTKEFLAETMMQASENLFEFFNNNQQYRLIECVYIPNGIQAWYVTIN